MEKYGILVYVIGVTSWCKADVYTKGWNLQISYSSGLRLPMNLQYSRPTVVTHCACVCYFRDIYPFICFNYCCVNHSGLYCISFSRFRIAKINVASQLTKLWLKKVTTTATTTTTTVSSSSQLRKSSVLCRFMTLAVPSVKDDNRALPASAHCTVSARVQPDRSPLAPRTRPVSLPSFGHENYLKLSASQGTMDGREHKLELGRRM